MHTTLFELQTLRAASNDEDDYTMTLTFATKSSNWKASREKQTPNFFQLHLQIGTYCFLHKVDFLMYICDRVKSFVYLIYLRQK